ncbi:MAG: ROK family protein [Pseudomonadota bacterium]
MSQSEAIWRVGIDLGGTKIAGRLLTPDGEFGPEVRVSTPADDYDATLRAIVGLVDTLCLDSGVVDGRSVLVGIGIPGSPAPGTGRIQNANSTWLNGRTFGFDIEAHLEKPTRVANDANCFALSEAVDGAAADATSVFGVILGTGCGGSFVLPDRSKPSDVFALDGPRGTGGEWGHNPLPAPRPDERPGPTCWCGRTGCLETWISGPGLAADHARRTGDVWTAEAIASAADQGNMAALKTLDLHTDRVARGLATVANILDPDIIVIGGGLSNLDDLIETLPDRMAPHIFADDRKVIVRRARWGDASGARGAARLWSAAAR